MEHRIILAGAGGQGIMLLGKILAEAAMKDNKTVTWLPSYGAEVRGGTANCMVVISEEEIGSPYIDQADSLIIFNQPSFERFGNRLLPGGILLLNASLVEKPAFPKKKIRLIYQPFTDIAMKVGSVKVANIVALGCFLAVVKLVRKETAIEIIRSKAKEVSPQIIELNLKAFEEGFILGQDVK
ncbi:MAG: 2-oxoacid:acceptor oxidoreductase family protein [Candidatus Omnitrophica bacterium]|nr:2-oxoacid:acceptor oxidoreductase family protein [Candidatus Omnitrophota bacterium]